MDEAKIVVKNETTLYNDVVVELPKYMKKDELLAHIHDAEKALGNSYTFQQFINKLEEMGFYIKEQITDVSPRTVTHKSDVVMIVSPDEDGA